MGSFGKMPNMVPVRVVVRDEDLGRTVVTRAEVIPDNTLFGRLAASTVLEGFDRGLDRVGAGTSKVRFTVKGEGLPYPVVRTNYFYTYSDIAALSLNEIAEVLDLLLYNDYYDIKISEVFVEADFTEEKHTAVIVSATPTKKQVYPGEELQIEVQIRPFRGEYQTLNVVLPIPERPACRKSPSYGSPGDVYCHLRRTGAFVTEKLELQSEERVGLPVSQEALDWEKVLQEFMNREKNNQIVVEFYPPYSDIISDDLYR